MQQPVVVFAANRGYALSSSRKELIQKFISSGWKVVLATADDAESQFLCRLGAELEPVVFNRGGLSFKEDLYAYRKLILTYRKWQPVLVHLFHAKPNILGTLAARRCLGSAVRVVNTITGLGSAFVKDGWTARLASKGYSLSLPKADITIFQNRDDLDLFLKKDYIPERKTCLITGSGVDLQRFKMCSTYSEKKTTPVIIMLGRLLRQKGVNEFIEIARGIRQNWPQARFLWAGEEDLGHPDAVSVEWLCSQNDLEYLGRLDDVVPLFEQADVLLFTSYYREGVPRVILEAASMELPTVAFDVPGVREAVITGVTGNLVPKGNIGSMQACVEKLISNPEVREKMGKAARAMVEEKFDISSIVKQYLNVYSNLGLDL